MAHIILFSFHYQQFWITNIKYSIGSAFPSPYNSVHENGANATQKEESIYRKHVNEGRYNVTGDDTAKDTEPSPHIV